MKTISVVNIKGGVGKTTSAINICACLQEEGYKVLLADLDRQGNASMHLKAYSDDDKSTYEVLVGKDVNTKDVIKKTDYEGFDILPGNEFLDYAEKEILLDTTRSQHNRFKKALEQVKADYDFCIIDCPPRMNIITVNALVASDEVVVPTTADNYAISGYMKLVQSILEVKEEFNPSLILKGCFVTMDNDSAINRDVKQAFNEMLKDKYFKTTIRFNRQINRSTHEQVPVVFGYRKSNASQDYRNLVKEMFL